VDGVSGHLVTMTSAAESAFVLSLLTVNYALAGGYQLPDQPTPADGWRWVTGEPWEYTDWGGTAPDDVGPPPDRAFGVEDYEEQYLAIGTAQAGWEDWNNEHITEGWLDHYGETAGYFVEYDTPELPSGALLVLSALPVGFAWWRRRKAL